MTAQIAQNPQCARCVFDQCDFGNFDAQPTRILTGLVDHPQQPVGEIVGQEMPRRHIDRHVPLRIFAHRSDDVCVHQPVDLFDQTAVLAHADEGRWREQASVFVVPAHQRFVTDLFAVLQAQNRLKMRLKRILHDRAAQIRLQIEQPHRFGAHLLVEHFAAVAAQPLCAIHRGVGVAQQFLALAIARVPHRDANARRRKDFAAFDPHRLAQCAQDIRGAAFGLCGAFDVFGKNREFIAAKTRDQIIARDDLGDAATGFDQQFIACNVADTVVDEFKTVDIQEQHRKRLAIRAADLCDGVIKPLLQLTAIGQPGQTVVTRLMPQALLRTQTLGDLFAQLLIGFGQFLCA